MCGICGISWRDGALVRRMAATMCHRGPDQEGFYEEDRVSLGHRRLSIIDLSEHGRQPMASEDGAVWLVFNGEIYNFQDLREDLMRRGHRFSSRADSEVIVHAYEEFGIEALHRLRGMFAFGLWDARRGALFLARDRIGIKPLYYHCANGRLAFASEIKALLEWPALSRELNLQALFDYIGYEFVPAPETMFRDVQKLPAGHYLWFENGQADVRCYWDVRMSPPARRPRYEEAVEEGRALLEAVVKSHLVSDVPLGVFLSGGLDSSAIVAMMRRHITGPLRTFTIGYPDKTFSELDYAQLVAERFGTEHHVLMIDDLREEHIERALRHLDEPMTDLSAVPLMLVCEKARAFVTVCLSGEGGDESFAGYDRFKASRINQAYGLVPDPARRLISRLVAALPDQPQKKGAVNLLKRFVEGADLPPDGHHLRWQHFSYPAQDRRLFTAETLQAVNTDRFRLLREHLARCDATDRINREIYLDLRFMMTDSVLMKVDKMSMASSMEVRVPLIDHEFVEFFAKLPGEWKLKGLRTKYIFRSMLEGILPDRIVWRGKQGYSLPVKHLLRGTLKNYMTTLLRESPLIRRYMNPEYVERLMEEHLAMKHNHNHVLWALMNVAIWDQQFRR